MAAPRVRHSCTISIAMLCCRYTIALQHGRTPQPVLLLFAGDMSSNGVGKEAGGMAFKWIRMLIINVFY